MIMNHNSPLIPHSLRSCPTIYNYAITPYNPLTFLSFLNVFFTAFFAFFPFFEQFLYLRFSFLDELLFLFFWRNLLSLTSQHLWCVRQPFYLHPLHRSSAFLTTKHLLMTQLECMKNNGLLGLIAWHLNSEKNLKWLTYL